MTWQDIWNHYINLEPGLTHIALRLACAMLVGIVIGLEREYTHRPAGLRTHILVALGACVASLMGDMIFSHFSTTADPARLSAQVITGVGFLGAGTIMKEGVNVKGLTTAASVWAVACLGIAAGFGFYAVALLGMLFIMITLTVVEALQHRFIRSSGSQERYVVKTEDVSEAMTQLYAVSQSQNAVLDELSVEKVDSYRYISFRATFFGRRHKQHHARFLAAIAVMEGVLSVSSGEKTTV